MTRILRTIAVLPILLSAGAPATSGAAAGYDALMCRGPLKQKLFHRGELDRWTLALYFKWAPGKVGFAQDLEPGQCGWATTIRPEPSEHRLQGGGSWLSVDTYVTQESGVQKIEYVWTLRNEANSSSTLFAFKIPQVTTTTQQTGYIFAEKPSISLGVDFH